jgi:hypothetical protein
MMSLLTGKSSAQPPGRGGAGGGSFDLSAYFRQKALHCNIFRLTRWGWRVFQRNWSSAAHPGRIIAGRAAPRCVANVS